MQQSCQHVKNKLKFQIGPFNNLAKGYEIKHFELKSSSKSILSIYASSGIGAAIGVIVSVIVGGFVYLVQFAQNLDLFGDARFIQLGAIVLDIKICFFIILAAIAILILRKIFGITKWNGPADSIYAAHQNTDELDIKTGVASTMAALVSAAGYASVGQYGPLVHFGATAGTAAKKLLNLRIGTDVVIGCGVAAAISSGFAAPIAGVIFAHEAILRHYSPSAMAPIATSAIVAAAMESYFFNIPHPLEIVEVGPSLVSAFLPVAIAGVVFGLVAIIFMHSLRYFASLNARLNRPVYQTIFVAVLAVITVSLFIPEALGLGTGVLASILNIQGSLVFILSLLSGQNCHNQSVPWLWLLWRNFFTFALDWCSYGCCISQMFRPYRFAGFGHGFGFSGYGFCCGLRRWCAIGDDIYRFGTHAFL